MHTRLAGALGALGGACLLLLADSSHLIAQAGTKLNEREGDLVISSLLSAWARADAGAIADQYESDGDFVSPDGTHALGRPAIEAFYAAAFKAGYAGSGASAKVLHTRRLSGTFALVDGCWNIEPTSASKIATPEAGLFVAVLHRHDGRWWIVALREQTSAQFLRELGSVR